MAEAFPGVRLHVVSSRPPESSDAPKPITKALSDMPSARRPKTTDDLRPVSGEVDGVRFASTNNQWAALGDLRGTPVKDRAESADTGKPKKEKEKKDKHKKEKEKEREREREKETSEQEERQQRRQEPKPRPMRQMSTGAMSTLTSDYVKARPEKTSLGAGPNPRASLAPPAALTGKRLGMGRHSNADMRTDLPAASSSAPISSPLSALSSGSPKGRFFGRPMEELSTATKEGLSAPISIFSTRTSLAHTPLILFALAEIVFRRGVKGSIHGLFRISGRAPRIAELREQIDQLPAGNLKSQIDHLLDGEDIHVLTGLLKLLLREQPEPLVPSSFRCLTDAGEQEDRLLQGRTLISLMTSKHRASFFYVFELLARVRDEKDLRMSSTALGVVFGPVVMRVNETDLAQFHIASAVVEAIVDHFLALTVPTPSSFLSPRGSQIRLSQHQLQPKNLSHSMGSHSPPPIRAESSGSQVSAQTTILASSTSSTMLPNSMAGAGDVRTWNPVEVSVWIAQLGLPNYSAAFKEHQVDGLALLELDRFDLMDMGVRLIGHQKTILRNIRTLSPHE